MPPASSSRSRRRRQPSEDIEDDSATQARANDVDEDVPQTARAKGKKRSQVQPEEQPAGEAEAEDEGPPPDIVKDFKDQPLTRAEFRTLGGVAEDWGMIRRQVHTSYFGLMNEIGASVAEFVDGDKGEKVRYFQFLYGLSKVFTVVQAMLDIDNMMRQLLDTDNELRSHEETLKAMLQQAASSEYAVGVSFTSAQLSSQMTF